MSGKDAHREAAILWAFADSARTGRFPQDPECALTRANDLLDVVNVYYRTAKDMFGDTDEVRSLAPVMDALYLHTERMGSSVLLAREVESAFPPDADL